MITPRQSGNLLLCGVLLPLVVLLMHPSGHDLAHDQSGRTLAVNYLVHGIAIACLPLLATGLTGLCAWLRWSAGTTLAGVVYAIATTCNLIAATMSGFVGPRLLSADPIDAPTRTLLNYTHDINQAFAMLAVVATGAAFLAWGVALYRQQAGQRGLAAIGGVVGLGLLGGILSGQLQLDVQGILIATAMQAAWLLPLAHALRQQPGNPA